jgi:hypothetical protein
MKLFYEISINGASMTSITSQPLEGTSKHLLLNLIAALVLKAFGIEILFPTSRDSGFCAPSALHKVRS